VSGPDPAVDSGGYPADPDHNLLLELVDPMGVIRASFHVAAPVNQNTQAPWMLQVALMHDDRCSRVIQRVPVPPY